MTGVEIATLAIAAGSAAYGVTQQRAGEKRAQRAGEAATAASAQQVEASRRAERARKRQADLELSRERRKSVRNAIIARSDALSGIVGRGIGLGGSAFGGAAGSIQSQLGQQVSDINQNQQLGDEVFAANEQFAQAGDALNAARGESNRAASTARQGQAFQNFGSTIASNFGPITRVGNSLTGNAGSGFSRGPLGFRTTVTRG